MTLVERIATLHRKDRADLDVEATLGVLVADLGGTDERIERLRALRS